MNNIQQLLINHIDIWAAADTEKKSGRGRGSNNPASVYGVKKLRGLILELAVRGKLVPQDPNDEPAIELIKRIQGEKNNLIAKGGIKKDKLLPPIANDEKLYKLPQGWEWTTIRSVCLINPRNNAADNLLTSFVPMAMIGTAFNCLHDQEPRLWKEIKQGFTHFAEGDIGIAKITPCFENSKACVFSGLCNGLGAGTTELHIIRPVKETLLPRYVLAYLKSPQFLFEGGKKMTGTAGQKRLPKEFVELNPFPLPPLPEQYRIVTKIDELMGLCDQLETRHNNAVEAHEKLVSHLLGTLTQSQNSEQFSENWQRVAAHFDILFTTESSIDALKKTLLQLAVMGKLVPQDPNDEPANGLILRILKERDRQIKQYGLRTIASEQVYNAEKYISIPESWQYCRLGNLARFIDYRGKTPRKIDSGIPLITAKNVRFGYISREPEEYISVADYNAWMTRGFPRVGDMLFTTEAPLGNIAMVDLEEKFALAQRVICFQLHDQSTAPYLKIAIMSDQVQRQLINSATGMTATGIKASKLKEIPVPLPPIEEQYRIVIKVNELMVLCDQLQSRITERNKLQTRLSDAIVEKSVM